MRLLEYHGDNSYRLTDDLFDKDISHYPYAILSHRWEQASEEVTFEDIKKGSGREKAGYTKIQFCGEQAIKDGLKYFWVDSCCIDKSNSQELQEAITSMFRWYQRATKCYVYLSDVTMNKRKRQSDSSKPGWEPSFLKSGWFTRGWTLQELLAPTSVGFFSKEGTLLGNKQSLEQQIQEITGIPKLALRGSALSQFNTKEIFIWAKNRRTTREEDWAYSLFGIFGVSMPIIYGEGMSNAVRRLRKEINDASRDRQCLQYLNALESCQMCQTDGATLTSGHLPDCFVSSVVQETRDAFLSTDLPWQRYLAHMYRRLAEQTTLLHELQCAVRHQEASRAAHPRYCPNCNKPFFEGWSNHCAQVDNTNRFDATFANIFFGCTSRFSQDISNDSINHLATHFTGSPAYPVERDAFSHPQLYAAEGLFSSPLFVLAMKQNCDQDQVTQQYYLLYAQTPRCWLRVIVTATFTKSKGTLAIPQISSAGGDLTCKILPDSVRAVLHAELPRINLFPSATRISLCLDEDGNSKKVGKSVEDPLEVEMLNREDVLRNIEVMSLHQHSESEIEAISRISSSRFLVRLDRRLCIERKMPLASGAWDDKSGVQDFVDDLKLLNSLQGCQGIPRLIGVVFDDAYVRVKGYLYEAPMIWQLVRVFHIAKSRSESIAWPIRLLWSKQIAQTIADVHRKGLTIGMISLNFAGLRADGSLVFTHLGTSTRRSVPSEELIPPELKNQDNDTKLQVFNERTDIFQLGLFLWLLAEQRDNTKGERCSRNACTNIPRYQCTADHADPIYLPPCASSIPLYFSNIITLCRSRDPQARPTARRILNILSTYCNSQVFFCDSLQLSERNTYNMTFLVHCGECGAPALDRHYHCYVCKLGDFDLCPDCVDIGIHCNVMEHQLVERIAKNGCYVHAN